MYKVKEIYYTIQGEGHHAGRPAVFLRFTGCNLWTGREEDRDQAICKFCDTDFRGMDGPMGGKYTAESLAHAIHQMWPDQGADHKFLVCTGGEPLLQLDEALIEKLHDHDFEIAVETNGTVALPKGLDWVCVSPKANTEVVVTRGNELKLVYPQRGIQPEELEDWKFDYFFLQPMDGPDRLHNTKKAIEYCKLHPKWRLSIQSHKYLQIP